MKNRKLTFVFVYLFAFCMMATVPAFAAPIIGEDTDCLRSDIIGEEQEGFRQFAPAPIIGGEDDSVRRVAPAPIFGAESEGV